MIDSHCHLDQSYFGDERPAVLDRARQAGVRAFVCVGVGRGSGAGEEAAAIAAAILGQEAGGLPGVIHCFTGGVPEARAYLDLGQMLSFSGIVTFKNAGNVREAAAYAPLDRILIETDAPYLAPIPHRGRRN